MAPRIHRIRERKLAQWAVAYLAGAWVVFEVSDTVGGRWGVSDVFYQAFFALLVGGFFVTMVLAWYHGEKGRQRVSGPELLMIALLLAILGTALGALDGENSTEVAARSDETGGIDQGPSVAVLPCSNFSPDPSDQYLASSIHDEILLRLTRVSGLTSLGRTSVEGYREAPPPTDQIAAELGVGFIGECSVANDPRTDRIRLTFQLMDMGGAQIWAESFDRDLTAGDLFDIYSDIAQRVAAGVGATLSPVEQVAVEVRHTNNSRAYEFYLRGVDYWLRPGYLAENWIIAEQMWTQAVELDQGFALARAKLSFLHGRTYFFSRDISEERLLAQELEAREALRLQAGLPEAIFADGYVHYVRNDLDGAIEAWDSAQAGAPNNPNISAFLGYAYRRRGDWDAWERAYQRTIRLDPRNPDIYSNLGGETLGHLRRFEEAVQALARTLELAPDMTSVSIQRGKYLFFWTGDTVPLEETLASLPDTDGLATRLTWARWKREAGRGLDQLSLSEELQSDQYFVEPRSLTAAWFHRLAGDEASAQAAFDSARVVLEALLLENPADFRIHGALGFVYAGLGRPTDAAEAARSYVREATFLDPYFQTGLELRQIQILAQADMARETVQILDVHLSAERGLLTVPRIRADPLFDPVRSDPRFQALLEKYSAG